MRQFDFKIQQYAYFSRAVPFYVKILDTLVLLYRLRYLLICMTA